MTAPGQWLASSSVTPAPLMRCRLCISRRTMRLGSILLCTTTQAEHVCYASNLLQHHLMPQHCSVTYHDAVAFVWVGDRPSDCKLV